MQEGPAQPVVTLLQAAQMGLQALQAAVAAAQHSSTAKNNCTVVLAAVHAEELQQQLLSQLQPWQVLGSNLAV